MNEHAYTRYMPQSLGMNPTNHKIFQNNYNPILTIAETNHI